MRVDIGQALIVGLAGVSLFGLAGCQWMEHSERQREVVQQELGDEGESANVVVSEERTPPIVMSLLGQELTATPPGDLEGLEVALAEARERLAADIDDADAWIWVGRRLGYLWRMEEAVEVFGQGLDRFPDDARFLRHRGHRYISLRRFDEAIADLKQAAALMGDRAFEIEADGKPNARNVPLTTLGYNVWYHLGVAYYLTTQFEEAVDAFARTRKFGRGLDDNTVSTTDWMYLSLRRLGRSEEARMILRGITPEMDIIENHAYHRRLLMYRGLLPAESLESQMINDLEEATMGYGLGMWFWLQRNPVEGKATFERVVEGRYWPAFGFIASEVELARAAGGE
jgi:tetratricopeptide (TPR) repeat protein